ncbi:MAG: hypothetical protein ABIQ49_03300, partial [Gemmatimonadales bacterium]
MRRLSPALLVWLAACTGYTPPAPPSPRDATPIAASSGTSWDAAIDLLAARNIPIRTLERASGFIATEQLSVGTTDGLAWADCGKFNGQRVGPNSGIYNVLVRGDFTHSSVKATVRWVYRTTKARTYECATSHVWEEGFEAGVKMRAEHALPPPSPVGQGASPPSDLSSGVTGDGRPNNLLLGDVGFRRAIGDMQRKGLILG